MKQQHEAAAAAAATWQLLEYMSGSCRVHVGFMLGSCRVHVGFPAPVQQRTMITSLHTLTDHIIYQTAHYIAMIRAQPSAHATAHPNHPPDTVYIHTYTHTHIHSQPPCTLPPVAPVQLHIHITSAHRTTAGSGRTGAWTSYCSTTQQNPMVYQGWHLRYPK